jgi:hypothetical protein
VELSAVEQLVEPAQARAIALALAHSRTDWSGHVALPDALRGIIATKGERGLDAFQTFLTGDLADFRIYELTAFLNRIRGFRTT